MDEAKQTDSRSRIKKTAKTKSKSEKVVTKTTKSVKTAKPKTKRKTSKVSTPKATSEVFQSFITMEQRQQMIATAAYYRAEQRGFSDGDPVDDWLVAEADIDTKIANNQVM